MTVQYIPYIGLTDARGRHTLAGKETLSMPKYMVQASYTNEGIKGLIADSASGRKADVQRAIKDLGGKVDAFYYAFGSDDVLIIVDMPTNIAASAFALTTTASGAVRVRTTPLLTVEEVDQALEMKAQYRAPGAG
jgi:uncharacterized protein with GYD domain